MTGRFVSIVMPALNEAAHIGEAIRSVIPGDGDYEILVVDGGSLDETREIVLELGRVNPRIRLLENPARRQSAAMNLAAIHADPRSTILLRADCHSVYPPGFAALCIKALTERSCASVVVPMETRGHGCMQKAIAAAQNSRLGNGGSKHRLAGSSGYVNHGHHAAFDRAIFLGLGGYCEDMIANEDAEFDKRLTHRGHKIWLCGEATITYFPRSDLHSLARQYFTYGVGRAVTCLSHGSPPHMRQILPALVTLVVIASLGLGLLSTWYLLPSVIYILSCVLYGLCLGVRQRSLCSMMAGFAAITMHMSWGVGFLLQIARGAVAAYSARGASGISRTR